MTLVGTANGLTELIEVCMRYRVKVRLEYENEVEADDKNDAFLQVSEQAYSFGEWDYEAEEIEEEEDE